tara:strand:- start:670 stop:1077 length:408 start_codon:yes stop_codon:yes gene_type:complete
MDLIQTIPYDLLLHIKSYIPKSILITLSKEKYLQYQGIIKSIVLNRQESYIRHILRCDLDFILLLRIKEYGNEWCKINKQKYKNMFFQNKLFLYKYYAIDNNAQKCKLLIDEYINERLNIKRHKKYKTNKTIWSN